MSSQQGASSVQLQCTNPHDYLNTLSKELCCFLELFQIMVIQKDLGLDSSYRKEFSCIDNLSGWLYKLFSVLDTD